MTFEAQRYRHEQTLFVIALVISISVWLAVVLSLVGIVYLILGFVSYLIIHALMMAGIKGSGVLVSAEQFPELYAKVESATRKLAMPVVPDVYLLNHRGGFNAFATRFWGRNFVVLYADLLEACDEVEGASDFVIAHELAHHALGHLKSQGWLLPARAVPWLGPAYSRACEYSSDSVAAMTTTSQAAVHGLAVLAAGPKYAKTLKPEVLIKQAQTAGHFWQAVVELNATHPFLSKRVAAVLSKQDTALAVRAGRNPFAYVFAPMFGFASGGQGAVMGLMIMVAIIGIMAAVAVPSLVKYQQRLRAQAAMQQQLGGEVPVDAQDALPRGLVQPEAARAADE